MRDEFVQGEQLLVRLRYCIGIAAGMNTRAGLESLGTFTNNRILEGLSCNFPKRDESVDGIRETDGKHSVIACRAQRLEVEIERPVESIRPEQHQDIQPIERIDEANRDIHIVLQPVTVV